MPHMSERVLTPRGMYIHAKGNVFAYTGKQSMVGYSTGVDMQAMNAYVSNEHGYLYAGRYPHTVEQKVQVSS
jgi:hypothetical protein